MANFILQQATKTKAHSNQIRTQELVVLHTFGMLAEGIPLLDTVHSHLIKPHISLRQRDKPYYIRNHVTHRHILEEYHDRNEEFSTRLKHLVDNIPHTCCFLKLHFYIATIYTEKISIIRLSFHLLWTIIDLSCTFGLILRYLVWDSEILYVSDVTSYYWNAARLFQAYTANIFFGPLYAKCNWKFVICIDGWIGNVNRRWDYGKITLG